jgi:polyferredoxin
MTDSTYLIPLSVVLFFLLPILFAFLFGRVFCAGVCPFGALQELVNVKNIKVPRVVATVLGLMPWIYLIFALLYAVTRSSFIICKFDPFIGIFRLGGDFGMIVFGALLLVVSIFVGRPFCRFLCPYGALLSLFSRVSIWKVRITPKQCNNCELCHNACPVDAIRAPYDNKVSEPRREGVKRLVVYFAVLPLLILGGAFLMRLAAPELSRVNKEVKLYDMVAAWEAAPGDVMPLEVETFYGQGGTPESAAESYAAVQAEFKKYSTAAGALLGLVVGLTLVRLSLKRARREYKIDPAACVACGRCFGYCPQNDPETDNANS